MTHQEIREWCIKYNISNFTIQDDGTVNVNSPVFIIDNKITKIPIKFGTIEFGFYCEIPNLTTLENCPYHVGGFFEVKRSKLRSLKGGPVYVGGNFDVENNCLESLVFFPEHIGGSIYVYNNPVREDECYYNTLLKIVESVEYPNYNTLEDVLDGIQLTRMKNYMRLKTIKGIIDFNE